MKLKKLLFISVLTLLFGGVNLALADTQVQSAVTSGKLPKSSNYPTDIWVDNHSFYTIYVTVTDPKTNINDPLSTGQDDELYSYQTYQGYQIVLTTAGGGVFFNQFVPNHATVIVDNESGARASGTPNASQLKVTVQPR